MSFSPEQLLEREQIVFQGTAELTNVAATIATYWQFYVPHPMTFTRLWAVYKTEGGTGPALTITLRRGTTALLSVLCDTDGTAVTDTTVDTGPLTTFRGETFNIAFTSANADNDFAALNVQVFAVPRL